MLLGTLTVAACSDQVDDDVGQEVKQQSYNSLADCQKDWGSDGRNCTAVAPNSVHSTPFVYMGPRYYYDRGYGQPVAINSDGTTRIVPGSFMARSAPSVATTTASVGRTASVASMGSVARGGFGATAAGHASAGG
ncbi:hypothetical protein [Ralstonia phage phiRSL1]|uniref:Uncharacterized protein n=1 Tax=Ralstonia phage phiRSL1 TaxID=1980924 RepID=B2ZXR6_9CAUD|nr:hypothetical protein RSL1_ORF051 [Ralstonia phage phiRSL1]BAG41497.2 hypothetical protein [Ralstonia phage phiRSL1]